VTLEISVPTVYGDTSEKENNMSDQFIIGTKPRGHDANIGIVNVTTGELVFCMSMERLTRKKRDPADIQPLIKLALEYLNIDNSQIIAVCFCILPSDTDVGVGIINKHYSEGMLADAPISYLRGARGMAKSYQGFKKVFRNMFPNCEVYEINHHLCHIAGSYYLSPFKSAALVTFDGRGEYETTVIYHGIKNRITKLTDQTIPHSIGALYMNFSYWFGLGAREGGKTMGLASYGDPNRFYNTFKKEIIHIDYNGNYLIKPHLVLGKFNPLYYNIPAIAKILNAKEKMDVNNPSQRYKDIAAALQKITEEVVVKWCSYAKRLTNESNLCLSGGVALNCSANGALIDKKIFDDIYIFPAPDDSGLGAGAALYAYYNIFNGNKRHVLTHPFLGTGYSVKKTIGFNLCSSPAKTAAEEIAKGKVVAWYQGRMECGPRALGHRCILGDPRDPDMFDKLNRLVKHREAWRPFAPSVLEHKAKDFFEIKHPAPFMITTAKVREEKRELIPSVVHIDGTARLQTVNKEFDELYFNLISEFEKITGIPLVINTSFNVRGEPIINTPDEAINCFKKTGIDVLIIGNCIMRKENDKSI